MRLCTSIIAHMGVVLLLVVMAGCSSNTRGHLSDDQKRNPKFFDPPYNKIEIGMSAEDMERLVGRKPDVTLSSDTPGVSKCGYQDQAASLNTPLHVVWIEDGRIFQVLRYDGTWNPKGATARPAP